MAYGDRTQCKACGAEIIQTGGGHRQRQYCDDSCKQRAYQERKEQAYLAGLRALWAGYLPETQEFLVMLTRQYSEDFARRFAAIIDAEKQSSLLASHDVSLLDLGKQLDYPELHIKHPSGGRDMIILAGLLSWTHFNEVAEGRAIRAAMMIARSILSNRQPYL